MKNRRLEQEVRDLKEKLAAAEQETVSIRRLNDQMQTLIDPGLFVHHGPNTIAHLDEFSIDHILREVNDNAPEVMALLHQMGNCKRFGEGESQQIATLRSVTALTTLLKCRSTRVLGLQLQMSIMLIARATSKQV